MAEPQPTLQDLTLRARDYMNGSRQARPDVSVGQQVDAATLHLQAVCPEAVDTALAAYAAIEGDRSQTYFDLGASTRDLVWIVDPVAGMRRACSATDLLRPMGPRVVARP